MKMQDWLLAMFILVPFGAYAEPFLSSAAYPAISPQPTEFLVTGNDTAEVSSAAIGVRQVSTITITAYDAATTYIVTIGGQNVQAVASGGTAAMFAQAFTATLNASVLSNFTPITWRSSGSAIIGKADVGGVAFTPTTSVTGGVGTISAPVAGALPTSVALAFDLGGLPFGTYNFSVRAQNATATTLPGTTTFEIGVATPEGLHVLPELP